MLCRRKLIWQSHVSDARTFVSLALDDRNRLEPQLAAERELERATAMLSLAERVRLLTIQPPR